MFRSAIYFSCLFFVMSCGPKDNVQPDQISSPGNEAESVYMTQNQHNNPVIAWTERQGNNLHFLYSVLENGVLGKKVNVPVPADVATHAEGMPKVAFGRDGAIIAAYETKAPTKGNKYAGAIYYVRSDDSGITWSRPEYLHSDTVAGRSRSFFDIEALADGEIAAAWLDIKLKNTKGGRSVRFAKTNGHEGFKNEIVVDSSACECCRIDLYCDVSADINIAYRGFMRGTMDQPVRDIMFAKSRDSGSNFSLPTRLSEDNWIIDGCPHTGPSLWSNAEGIHSLWYTEGGSTGIFYAYGQPNGGFTPRENVSLNGRHPQISGSDDRLVMIWEESTGDNLNSFNRIRYQIRTGNEIVTNYLTPDGEDAYFPVIVESDGASIVAYLMKSNGVMSVFVSRLNP